MKIGVDAGCLGIKDEKLKVGVYTMAECLLKEISKLDKTNEYILYSFYPIDNKILQNFSQRIKNIVVKPSKGWMKIWLPLRLTKDKPNVFLALGQSFPKKISFLHSTKVIGFIYDLAFENFPQMYNKSLEKLQLQTKKLVKDADIIIAISETTKKDIIEKYKVNSQKIKICHLGVLEELKPQGEKYVSKFPYFLFVGALKPLKNVPTLIKAFSIYAKNDKDNHQLFLVGGDNWLDEKIGKTLKEIPENVKEKIHFLGYVDNETLLKLYRGARAFISPSFYEGFGLPFLEAMASGCPVIGSTSGSIPEVVKDAGLLVDSKDEKELCNEMIKIVENKKLREKLIKNGIKRSKEFSWGKFAKEVLSIINDLKDEK